MCVGVSVVYDATVKLKNTFKLNSKWTAFIQYFWSFNYPRVLQGHFNMQTGGVRESNN